ncbi:Hypothetical protein NTJ_10121 [Nesidiocoris tenuis]|uniref:Uncharacterized protein n=1 Tax=Nesidiocoris tenuis TaxID=355587 RepID=A0ABN7B123_9HEMI|nr:Hypothetical protein NTJ_10121 [Nesidiocoris tenuis]
MGYGPTVISTPTGITSRHRKIGQIEREKGRSPSEAAWPWPPSHPVAVPFVRLHEASSSTMGYENSVYHLTQFNAEVGAVISNIY